MSNVKSSGCFRDSAGSDAVRANPQTLVSLADKNPDSLKVRIPASLRQIMGVADPMTVNWTFITDFTTCHEGDLPGKLSQKYNIGSARMTVILGT